MKPTTLLLAASLLANAALVTVYVLRSGPSNPDASVPAAGGSAASAATAGGKTPGAHPASAAAIVPRPAWERLRTDDLAALVPRLREAGFPPAVIRRIITRLVTERFDGRRLEIEKDSFLAPLATNNNSAYNDPKMGPELRQLQREQTELLKKLLGGNLADIFASSEDEKATLRLQVGDISPEKLEQLYTAGQGYSEKLSSIYASARNGGTLLDSDREKLTAAERAFREDIGKFLTPTEASDFLMRGSATGSQLLNTLAPFRASEQEYRAIFPVYQAFQEQFPQQGDLPPAQAEARRIAQEQMNHQLKTLLGADRAAEFQQAIDPRSQQLNRLIARLDLPLTAAIQVNAVQTEMQQRGAALRNDPASTPESRMAQQNALIQEAATRLTPILGGPRGLEAYKQYGGQWLVPAAPRPAAPTPRS